MGTVNTSNSTWRVLICVEYMVATWVQSTLATVHGMFDMCSVHGGYMGTVNTSNSTWHVLICAVYMVATWVQSTLATVHGVC